MNSPYYYENGRQLDDVAIVADTFGAELTDLTHNASGNSFNPHSSSLLNDIPTIFTATFNDRLDAARAGSAAAYDWSFAGDDGDFGTGDDSVLPLTPLYDGNFTVTLSADPGLVPYAAGSYRLIFRGMGPSALTDAEGNPFHAAADAIIPFTMIDAGPQVVPPTVPPK